MIQKKNKRLLAVYLVGDGTANFVKTDYQIVLSSCDGYSAEEQLTNARFYYYIFNPLSPESDEQQSSPWNTIFLHIGDENKGHDQNNKSNENFNKFSH